MTCPSLAEGSAAKKAHTVSGCTPELQALVLGTTFAGKQAVRARNSVVTAAPLSCIAVGVWE